MKKGLMILAVLFIGGVVALNTGCEEEPKETCEQDMFCDGTVAVTACCVEGGDCYYIYEGVEYPDTEQGLQDLIDALDCPAKNASVDEQNDYLISRLKMLIEEARIKSLGN